MRYFANNFVWKNEQRCFRRHIEKYLFDTSAKLIFKQSHLDFDFLLRPLFKIDSADIFNVKAQYSCQVDPHIGIRTVVS